MVGSLMMCSIADNQSIAVQMGSGFGIADVQMLFTQFNICGEDKIVSSVHD